MSPPNPMDTRSTLLLAHTARCKLQLAADRPDRNLRFILGHAFTLDKLMLRVVEIENSGLDFDDEQELDDDTGIGKPVCTAKAPKVKFRSAKVAPPATGSLKDPVVVPSKEKNDGRQRSPPPPIKDDDSDSSDEDDGIYDDYDEDEDNGNGLSLRRFASATSRPPRMIHSSKDDGESSSSSDDEDEPKSPPPLPMPTEAEIKQITSGVENEDLRELYGGVAECPCHGQHQKAPVVTRAWDLPRDIDGGLGERVVALVQVEA